MQLHWFEIVAWLLSGSAIVGGLFLVPRFERWFDEMIGEMSDGPGRQDDDPAR